MIEKWLLSHGRVSLLQGYIPIFDSELHSHVRIDHPVSSLMSSLTKRLHCWKGVNDEVTGKFIFKRGPLLPFVEYNDWWPGLSGGGAARCCSALLASAVDIKANRKTSFINKCFVCLFFRMMSWRLGSNWGN